MVHVLNYNAQQSLIHPLVAASGRNTEHSLQMTNNDVTRNKLINLQITQLTPAMTAAVQQAAAILHHVFAPQGSWETLEGAIQEVQEMLIPERMVWVAMVNAEVIGWIGGVPHYDGNVWELIPWWSNRNGSARASAAGWWKPWSNG